MDYAQRVRGPAWWQSYDRLDAIFGTARNAAIGAFTLAAASWIAGLTMPAILLVIGGTTAVLIALFSWFRRDDLSRGPRS
jgi:hypothetical protein